MNNQILAFHTAPPLHRGSAGGATPHDEYIRRTPQCLVFIFTVITYSFDFMQIQKHLTEQEDWK